MLKAELVAKQMCDIYFYKYYVPILAKKEAQKREISDSESKQLVKSLYFQFRQKNLKYFIKASEMFSARKDFTTSEDFISAILNESFVYPPQLTTEGIWRTFLRNKGQFVSENRSELFILAENVKKFFVFLNGRTIEMILSNIITANQILSDYGNANLDLTVLCFSKVFKEFSKKERMDIDFKSEQSKIKKYKKIVDKIKEKLNEDFFEEV